MLKQACCVEEHSAGPGGGAGGSPLRETAGRLCRMESVTALARESAAKAGKTIAAYPVVCLLLAATCGIALGWWVKRR
jgi:hypothetical protein